VSGYRNFSKSIKSATLKNVISTIANPNQKCWEHPLYITNSHVSFPSFVKLEKVVSSRPVTSLGHQGAKSFLRVTPNF